MMTLLAQLMRNNPLVSAMTGLVIILALSLFWQKAEIANLDEKLALCRAQGEGLKFSNATLQQALRQQNDAVEAIARQSFAKKQKSATAADEARQKAAGRKQIGQAVLDKKLAGDDCTQMKQLLRDFVSLVSRP